jgi:ankyrin repeat protein
VSARNCYGSTPLHCAAVSGMQHAAALLLAAGADLNGANNGGWTPLQYAIRGGEGYCDPEFVAWMVRAAAAVAQRRADTGRSPLPPAA